jgi:hypothetical protein
MKFDLNQNSNGVWFTFFNSDVSADGTITYHAPEKDAGRVQIRIADADTYECIQKDTRTHKHEFVYNKVTRQMERVSYVEQTSEQKRKERELIWDYAIQAWEGILDKNGNPIPCTTENKIKLMNIPVFSRFVSRCLDLINLSEEARKSELEKN